MDWVSALAAVGGLLLVAGGVPKLHRPAPTAAALAAVELDVPDAAVRTMGLGEVLLGAGVVGAGTAPLALLAALVYVGFGVFVAVAMSRHLASCGCFGAAGRPPGWPHLLVDLGLAAALAAAAAGGPRSLPDLVGDQPAWLVAVVAAAVACLALLAGRPSLPPVSSGQALSVADVELRSGRVALVFLSTSCLTCRDIWRALGAGPALPGGARPVVVVKDDEPADVVSSLAPRGVTVVRDSAAWVGYGVHLAPAVVVVDGGEVVTAAVTASWDDLLGVVEACDRSPAPPKRGTTSS